MAGDNHVPRPSTLSPLVDGNGNVTMAWRAWVAMVDDRVGGNLGFTLPNTEDVAGDVVKGVTWTSGTGAPPVETDPKKYPTGGSLYSQTNGAISARLWVAQGDGTWLPVAGV